MRLALFEASTTWKAYPLLQRANTGPWDASKDYSSNFDMHNLAFLIGPALMGLIAGIGHGVVSHHADLPLSLTDQLLQPLTGESWQQD